MNRTSKTIAAAAVFGTAISLLSGVTAQAAETIVSTRIAGPDRYATSAAVATKTFRTGATTVYLAQGGVIADALAGGALTDGPVMLVAPGAKKIPTSTKRAISAVGATEVVALGGTGVVSDAVLADAAAGRKTSRLGGNSRYETAASISKRAFPYTASNVYLVSGEVFADAVSAGTLTDGPILPLPSKGAAPKAIIDEIARLRPAKVTAIGAISDATAEALAKPVNATVDSIRGASRYETSALIAKRAFPKGSPSIYLTSGTVLADAVSAGSVTDGPILLTHPTAGVEDQMKVVGTMKPKNVVALGGSSVISDDFLEKARATSAKANAGSGGNTGGGSGGGNTGGGGGGGSTGGGGNTGSGGGGGSTTPPPPAIQLNANVKVLPASALNTYDGSTLTLTSGSATVGTILNVAPGGAAAPSGLLVKVVQDDGGTYTVTPADLGDAIKTTTGPKILPATLVSGPTQTALRSVSYSMPTVTFEHPNYAPVSSSPTLSVEVADGVAKAQTLNANPVIGGPLPFRIFSETPATGTLPLRAEDVTRVYAVDLGGLKIGITETLGMTGSFSISNIDGQTNYTIAMSGRPVTKTGSVTYSGKAITDGAVFTGTFSATTKATYSILGNSLGTETEPVSTNLG